jgi:hypothetical protein
MDALKSDATLSILSFVNSEGKRNGEIVKREKVKKKSMLSKG